MYHFTASGLCQLRQRGDGGLWCRRQDATERAARRVWEQMANPNVEWSAVPDLAGQWCNTGASGYGEKGWATTSDADGLDACQQACEDEDDCVGVSYFTGGPDDMSRVTDTLDAVLRSPCNFAQVLLSYTDSPAACKEGFPNCVNRPADVEKVISATSSSFWEGVLGQKERGGAGSGYCMGECVPKVHLPQCTLCYRVAMPCSTHGDATDCTVLEVEGQPGGTYFRPRTACPSRVGGADLCGGWLAKECTAHDGAQCAAGNSHCMCPTDGPKPCARKLMGAKRISLIDMGYKPETASGFPGVHSSENEWAHCVSEEEYCTVRKTFKHASAVSVAFFQAQMLTLRLIPMLTSSIGVAEDIFEKQVCNYLSPSGVAGALSEFESAPAMAMARIFGIFQCYMSLLESVDEDRGREFGVCLVRAVLGLVTYLAMQYSGLGALEQADLLAKLASPSVQESLAKAQDTLNQAADAADLIDNETMDDFPTCDAWGIDGALDMVQASAEIVTKLTETFSSLDSMIVETGTLLMGQVLDQTLDLNGWAHSQPSGLDLDHYFCNALTNVTLDEAFNKIRKVIVLVQDGMEEFVGNFTVTREEPIETCTSTPKDSLCGVLGHNYKISAQFRDASMLRCHERSVIRKYQALLDRPEFATIISQHPVCVDSLKDLLCLSAYPSCGKGGACSTLTACNIACRNLNTCASSLAFPPPYDCDLQCACATSCSDESVQNGLQEHAQEKNRCSEMCGNDKECKDECLEAFETNLGQACKAVNSLSWTNLATTSKLKPDDVNLQEISHFQYLRMQRTWAMEQPMTGLLMGCLLIVALAMLLLVRLTTGRVFAREGVPVRQARGESEEMSSLLEDSPS
ncbi:unnamed protein product [Polarella glacialis]|uniref:Uncharacterized protein n=1 Tax=Polarella glacialis TaxID=89957 RepID=A0A813IU33_POLGL|nr:unnamed protein product [Polarella glacialis]